MRPSDKSKLTQIPIILWLALVLTFGQAEPAQAKTWQALPPTPAGGWEPWYAIDFRNGYQDGHWTRINGSTPYLDCHLNHGWTSAQGRIDVVSEGMKFKADNAHVSNTLYTNDVLPPEGHDFIARWKIKWIMDYEGWGMGIYFGTVPYDGTYYEHPAYCRDIIGPFTNPLSRIASMQGDGLSGDEIGRWFTIMIEYDASERTATQYVCDGNGNHCQYKNQQTIPPNEYPTSFHIGHIKRVRTPGNFQQFVVQYLQIYHRVPEVTVNLTNPEGQPVARPMGGATWNSWWGFVFPSEHQPWGTRAAHTGAPPNPGSDPYHGAYVDLQTNDVPMWALSSISAHGSQGYGWYDDGDKDGDRDVYVGWSASIGEDETANLVIATQTPAPSPTPTATPSPTPYVQVNVRNPEGTPVAVEEVIVGDPNETQSCSNCSTMERATGSLGSRIFARIRRLADQILWGWSTTADNAELTAGQRVDELAVDNWDTGGVELKFTVVTPTPTPTPQDVPPFEHELDHTYVYPDDFCTYIVGGVYAADHSLEDAWVRGTLTTTQGQIREVAATVPRRYIPAGDGSCFKIALCDLLPGETLQTYDLYLDASEGYRSYPYVRAYATEIEDLGSGYAHAEGRVWVDESSPYPSADNVSVIIWGWDAGKQQVTSCDAVGVGYLEQDDDPTAWSGYILAAPDYYYRTTSNPH